MADYKQKMILNPYQSVPDNMDSVSIEQVENCVLTYIGECIQESRKNQYESYVPPAYLAIAMGIMRRRNFLETRNIETYKSPLELADDS